MEWTMLQRTKIGDAARLAVVPAGETAEAKPPQAAPDQIENRGPPPQQIGAPAKKASATGALKANRKLILAGAAVAVLLAAGWFGFDYVTVGRFMVSTDD